MSAPTARERLAAIRTEVRSSEEAAADAVFLRAALARALDALEGIDGLVCVCSSGIDAAETMDAINAMAAGKDGE